MSYKYPFDFQVSSIASGSAVALTTATPANLTSIGSLPAGSYMVTGNPTFTGTPTISGALIASIGTTSATLGTIGIEAVSQVWLSTNFTAGDISLPVPQFLITLPSTGTIYLVCQGTFSAGSLSVYGSLNVQRLS